MAKGPVYGQQLIDALPVGGMLQAMPSSIDLQYAVKDHQRVVAGYEALLSHYERLRKALEDIRREHGQISINNGTSTLALFIDLVLKKH